MAGTTLWLLCLEHETKEWKNPGNVFLCVCSSSRVLDYKSFMQLPDWSIEYEPLQPWLHLRPRSTLKAHKVSQIRVPSFLEVYSQPENWLKKTCSGSLIITGDIINFRLKEANCKSLTKMTGMKDLRLVFNWSFQNKICKIHTNRSKVKSQSEKRVFLFSQKSNFTMVFLLNSKILAEHS